MTSHEAVILNVGTPVIEWALAQLLGFVTRGLGTREFSISALEIQVYVREIFLAGLELGAAP